MLTKYKRILPIGKIHVNRIAVRHEGGSTHGDPVTADRLALQRWVTRSLIKRGIWGSGLDTTLTRIRDALTKNVDGAFPVAEVEAAMAAVGKSLAFDTAEIDELLNLKYAGQRTFSVLSVLYPGLDLSKKFHEDHIFPKSRFMTRITEIPQGRSLKFPTL